jgi:hypothetical protein
MAGPTQFYKKKKKREKKGAGGDQSAALMAAATQQAGLAPGAQFNPNYQAAQSMLGQGVQSLSGLSGSQGQVLRFKTEQTNLINEYNNEDTSEERKEEIIKDLRGVSSDLNEANKNAAINYILREYGESAINPSGGLMGLDVGSAFQDYRQKFRDLQGDFKTSDPKLFKQVHPNPFLKLLGSAAQMVNLTPTGIIKNLGKIKKGEPLIDLSFMDKNMSESPSRLKNFYNAYMSTVNKDIQKEKNKEFDKVPIDKGFKDALGLNQLDFSSDKNYLLPGGTEEATLAGQEPYDPAIAEDKEAQEEIERSLLNQYSLLGQSDLATSLLDDTEETDLEEAINPDVDPATAAYEQEFLDTYGEPMKGNIEIPLISQPGGTLYGMGDRFTKEKFAADNNIPLNQIGEFYPKVLNTDVPELYTNAPNLYKLGMGDFTGDEDIPSGTVFSPAISNIPKLGDEIKSADFSNVTYKDGGSVYNILKLINDTMNDG